MKYQHYWNKYPYIGVFGCENYYPCGATNIHQGSANPNKVTCFECKELEIFKEDLYTFQIGFDGNQLDWLIYLENRNKEL